MKKTFIIILMILTTVSLFATGEAEKNQNAFVIGGSADWPPLEFIDEKGNVTGFEVDLVQAIAEAQGVELEYRNVAFDGLFAGLANGAYDGVASGISITEERKKAMDFTRPFLIVKQAIITLNDHPEYTDIDSLNHKKVGTQIGTTGDIMLHKYNEANDGDITDKAYDQIAYAIEDMINGNIDAVVCDNVVAADFVLSNPNYADKLIISGKAGEDGEQYAMCVSKGNDKVLKILDEGIEKVIANGEMDALKKKYHLN